MRQFYCQDDPGCELVVGESVLVVEGVYIGTYDKNTWRQTGVHLSKSQVSALVEALCGRIDGADHDDSRWARRVKTLEKRVNRCVDILEGKED